MQKIDTTLLAKQLYGLDRDAAQAAILDALHGILPIKPSPPYQKPEPPFPGQSEPASESKAIVSRQYSTQIPLPPYKVWVACSHANEGFARSLCASLNAFRLPTNGTAAVFDARTTLREAGTNLKSVIAEADLVLFPIQGAEDQVCRTLDLALRCQCEGKNRHPRVMGVVEGVGHDQAGPWSLPLLSFDGTPSNGQIHDFGSDIEIIPTPSEPDVCHRIHGHLHPRFTVIADMPSFEANRHLFQQAMTVYQKLIPDGERDDPENIEKWICNVSGTRDNWVDYLVIAHNQDGQVFGAFWCNIDVRIGLGHVPFWGMLHGDREAGMAVHLADTAMKAGQCLISERTGGLMDFKGVVFEAESVDLDIFRLIAVEACKELPPPAKWPEANDPQYWLKQKTLLNVIHPPSDKRDPTKPTPLEQALLRISEDEVRAKEIEESIRRFRRFSLYARASRSTKRMEDGSGYCAVGFIDTKLSRLIPPKDHQMAVYWQPPIIPNDDPSLPVRDEDKFPFSLFMLVKKGVHISAEQVVDWEYDCFLGEQFRDDVPDSGLHGWTEYMVEFKKTHRASFVESAELQNVQIGKTFNVAEAVLLTLLRWPKSRHDWKIIQTRIPLKL